MKVLIVSYYHNSTDAGGRRWRMLADKMQQDYNITVLYPDNPRVKRDHHYLIRFIVNHLFYPDYRKAFVRQAKAHLLNHKYDLVITSYPPLSMLQIGAYAKSKGMRWILDMRDPFIMYNNKWAGNTFVSNYIRGLFVIKYIHKADRITFITRSLLLSTYNAFRRWLKLADMHIISQFHD